MAELSIEIVEDRTAVSRCDDGFIKVRRYRLVNVLPDGTRSSSYAYDVVERRHIDAVAMVLHDRRRIMLRSALRPPLWFRRDQALPLPEDRRTHALELPAGLIEANEHGPQGIAACAARETHEETGLVVSAERFRSLGPPVLLSPGLCGEKVHFLAAEVDLDAARPPAPEGPVEEAGSAVLVSISDALDRLERGEIDDAKTEVGLRRLAALLTTSRHD
ncbi:MAG: NUDIX hydrolase [Deltaproteobacteria bacterium]|nr:NUDIX hydrolase [Deltaproteobacteria bacterium]